MSGNLVLRRFMLPRASISKPLRCAGHACQETIRPAATLQGVGTGCTQCLQLFCTARIAPPTYTSHHTLHTSHPATLTGTGWRKVEKYRIFSQPGLTNHIARKTPQQNTPPNTQLLSPSPPKREQLPVNSMGPFNSICLTGFLITFEIDSDLT